MADLFPTRLLRHIRRLVQPRQQEEPPPDQDLLARFVEQCDEGAFAAIVQRHGGLVLGVCLRLLGDIHDAEDVFQATFLVLARKAAAIRKRDSLASWLHGVALRLARKARVNAARHHALPPREVTMPATDPTNRAAWEEVRQILDEELERLPARYRLPLLLCCLQGKTRFEAAAELGWSEGAVRGKLERGRDLLHRRLQSRGVTLSAGLFATVLAEQAVASVPQAWVGPTVQAAVHFAAHQATAGAVSAKALPLAEEVLRVMLINRWKVAAVWLLVLTVTAAGTGKVAYSFLTVPSEGAPPEFVQAAADDRQPVASDESPPRKDLLGDPLPPGALVRMGTLRLHHEGGFHIAYSGDGKVLASIGEGVVRLWDTATTRELRAIDCQGRYLALSPDGRILAVKGKDSLCLWDASTGKVLRELRGHQGEVFGLAFSPDGKTLATGASKDLRLWDVATGKERHRFAGFEGFGLPLAFSPNGEVLATAGRDDTIRLWDPATGRERARLDGKATGLAFSPDSKSLATGGDDRTIHVWDVATGNKQRTFAGPDKSIMCLEWSPDGKILATASHTDPAIRLWDAASGQALRTIALPNYIFSMAFSPDGKVLAAAISWTANGEQRVRLWDPATGEELIRNPQHLAGVVALAFSTNSETLTTGSSDSSVRVWETKTGKERVKRQLPEPNRQVLAFSADGRLAAVRSERRSGSGSALDTTLCVWDVVADKQLYQVARVEGSADNAVFSADGKTLAVSTLNRQVLLVDVAAGKELGRIPVGAKSLAFSPDGRTLAAGGWDCAVRLLEIPSGKPCGQLGKPVDRRSSDGKRVEGITAVAFSPDGQLLAAAEVGERVIHLWHIASGRDLYRLAGQQVGWQQGWVYSMTFSPDGKALVSGGGDRAIHVWEVATGKERRRLTGQRGVVLSLGFSADGSKLASGSTDTTALVWDPYARRQNTQAKVTDSIWQDLTDADAEKAYDLMCVLLASPEPTVSALRKRLRPVAAPSAEHLGRLIAALDSEQFVAREKASKELEELGELAGPALKKLLSGRPSLELQQRAERLLEKLKPGATLSTEQVAALRAIEVLERIDTAEAREVLRRLTEGGAEARLTREARAALERLTNR